MGGVAVISRGAPHFAPKSTGLPPPKMGSPDITGGLKVGGGVLNWGGLQKGGGSQ